MKLSIRDIGSVSKIHVVRCIVPDYKPVCWLLVKPPLDPQHGGINRVTCLWRQVPNLNKEGVIIRSQRYVGEKQGRLYKEWHKIESVLYMNYVISGYVYFDPGPLMAPSFELISVIVL